MASSTDTDNTIWSDSKTVTIGASGPPSPVSLALHLQQQPVSIALLITYGSSKIAESIDVTLTNTSDNSDTFTKSTDDNGAVTFEGLTPKATYDIAASVADGGVTFSVPSPGAVTAPASGTSPQQPINLEEPSGDEP